MGKTFSDSIDPLGNPRLAEVLARLDGLVDWERRDRSAGSGRIMRVDLAPIAGLMRRLGSPEKGLRAVHVAGSKGKGSTALLIAEGLRRAGFRVGLYTSPHVECLNERIVVDGEKIGDAALAGVLEEVLEVRGGDGGRGEAAAGAATRSTWFDVLTAAALAYFAAQEVDVCVVECGLGGRLDSTNVIEPVLTVVTAIELEHAAILGGSLGLIAGEKGGIFAAGVPAVAAEAVWTTPAGRALRFAAARVGTSLVDVPEARRGTIAARNRALAGAALGRLGEGAGGWRAAAGRQVGPWLIGEVGRVGLPGRLERREVEGVDGVRVVLDGAHVPASLAAVLGELVEDPALGGPLICVFGCGRDKDVLGLLKTLAPRADRTLCTSAGTGPYAPSSELAALAVGLGMRAEAVEDAPRAFFDALNAAKAEGGWVLVTGSLHLVGALRSSTRAPTC